MPQGGLRKGPLDPDTNRLAGTFDLDTLPLVDRRDFGTIDETQLIASVGSLIPGEEWPGTHKYASRGIGWPTTAGTFAAVIDGEVSEEQAAALLKTFRLERFKVQLHAERREVDVYALVVARQDQKLGPELRPSAVECATAKGVCGDSFAPGSIRAIGRPIPNLLRLLERASGRLVIDRTGLTGPYDVNVRWQPLDAPDLNPGFPSLFTAVEEQLGLRLESARAPVDVLVIDSAVRPVTD